MWGKYYWTEITVKGRSLGRLWIPAPLGTHTSFPSLKRPDSSAEEERQFSIPPAHPYWACSQCNVLQSTRENTKWKKTTCHRGRSLQSQTSGPISPPRNCGRQSCYLLLLGQVLKELCWRPLQPMLHVLRSSEVWYTEQGGGQGKLYVWVDICSPEAGWDLLQRFVL